MESALQTPPPVLDPSSGPGVPEDQQQLLLQASDERSPSAPEAMEDGEDTGVSLTRVGPGSRAGFTECSLEELPEYLQQIRFRLELRIPLPRFTLRHLNALVPGTVLQTEHSSARDLVLSAAKERLLSVELEAVEMQLAARVKRLL